MSNAAPTGRIMPALHSILCTGPTGRLEALWPRDSKIRIIVSCVFKKHFPSKHVWGCVQAVGYNDPGLWTQTDLGLASSITGCVTWGKLLHLSESVFSSVRWE